MTNSDNSDKEILELKIFSMFTLDDFGMQMIESQENFILAATFTELRREVEMLRIFQDQNTIGNVAAHSKSRTHYEILQHIPTAERNRKRCSVFQDQNTIGNFCSIFQEQNTVGNFTAYSKSRTQ
jgi:hypothetical protein